MKKIILSFTFAFVGITSNSQWNPILDENLLVAYPKSGDAFSNTSSDGKTFIGYWKSVPAPINFELWLQILDKNGNKELGSEGIMLSNQIPMNTYTFVEDSAVDSSNNFYIGVTGTGVEQLGYIFKITPQGTSVWPNGINIGEALCPTLLPLSNGELLVSYWPKSKKYSRIERFNSSGQRVWNSPVVIKSDSEENTTIPADLFELPNNEFEIIFSKVLPGSGSYTSSYLYAQKFDFNGVKRWESPKQISTKGVAWNVKHSGVIDGNVVYYGFSGGTVGTGEINAYLQRINIDGSLPWGVNGVDFDISHDYKEKDMKIAFTPGSPYIWSIANYNKFDPSIQQDLNGEFIQKFDKVTGTRLFTDNAKQVFPVNVRQMFHQGNLHLVNEYPFFIVQKKLESTNLDISLNAVLLKDDGDFFWTQKYLPMATFPAMKSNIISLKPINRQSIILFQEKKIATDKYDKLYAQNLIIPFEINDHDHFSKNNFFKVKEYMGIKNTSILPIFLSPNPAKDEFSIIYSNNSLGKFNVEVYDLSGKLLFKQYDKEKISVGNLSNGVYVVKVITPDSKIQTEKLIVEK
ncbi:putative secreted protein (Por secretion system target) [Chryseobacterium sp. 7]|uniref:T9SS type A sorting domain-containing protein n=1 Tax=Chryseobacterium sp. 7 TaxID=2035214 RepID=UPI000EB069EC|nr:T9SS type A sorting domain-containing protein [Chryseobacterium sp. 7]RLJ30687.1 putative secreted protein (Por secretion system target) [Chryseobacterium sp. 7]